MVLAQRVLCEVNGALVFPEEWKDHLGNKDQKSHDPGSERSEIAQSKQIIRFNIHVPPLADPGAHTNLHTPSTAKRNIA